MKPLSSVHGLKLCRGVSKCSHHLCAWLALPLLSLSSAAVHAQLNWETSRIETSATAGDPEVIAEFSFTNATSTPIRILNIASSCDCTTATASADTIAPNQTGSVRAAFTLGDRVGRQEKTIFVTTNAAPSEPTALTLRVNISEVVASTPRILMWKIDEPPTEKMLELKPVPPHHIGKIGPPVAPPGFSCRFEQSDDSQRFVLYVIPESTRSSATAIIPLIIEIEGRPPVSHAVYALVK